MIYLYNEDALERMKKIEDKSVNLVLIDPPYNINKEKEWDSFKQKDYIEFMGEIFKENERILADNGALYWFHNDMQQIAMLMEWIRQNTNFIFNSFIIWDKGNFRSLSWKNPNPENNNLRSWFNTCEYCLYYVKIEGNADKWGKTGWDKVRLDVNNFKPLREYAYKMLCFIGGEKPQQLKRAIESSEIEKQNIYSIAGRKSIFNTVGGKADHFMRFGSTQWSLPTKETYEEITKKYNLRKWEDYKEYEELRKEYEELRKEYEELRPVHNLDTNHNNIWISKTKNNGKLHPCEKPVDILERIIKTSSNEGMTVLDCFMGSGSTGVACKNLNRNFIGIERNEKYFEIAKKRIENIKEDN